MASEIRANQMVDECENCKSRKFCGTDLLECLEREDCSWVVNFGYSRFCKKPYVSEMANSSGR